MQQWRARARLPMCLRLHLERSPTCAIPDCDNAEYACVADLALRRKICNGNLRRTVSQYILHAMGGELFNYSWEPRSSRKNSGSHIDASLSRQPLVKGERLVRYEVNAVIIGIAQPCTTNSGPVCRLMFYGACATSGGIIRSVPGVCGGLCT
jgi:hypothetical protein